ncbi:hypothetical protein R6Z07F_009343 [Ovis aries]
MELWGPAPFIDANFPFSRELGSLSPIGWTQLSKSQSALGLEPRPGSARRAGGGAQAGEGGATPGEGRARPAGRPGGGAAAGTCGSQVLRPAALPRAPAHCACSLAARGCSPGGGYEPAPQRRRLRCCDGDVRGPRRDGADPGGAAFFNRDRGLLGSTGGGGGGGRAGREVSSRRPAVPARDPRDPLRVPSPRPSWERPALRPVPARGSGPSRPLWVGAGAGPLKVGGDGRRARSGCGPRCPPRLGPDPRGSPEPPAALRPLPVLAPCSLPRRAPHPRRLLRGRRGAPASPPSSGRPPGRLFARRRLPSPLPCHSSLGSLCPFHSFGSCLPRLALASDRVLLQHHSAQDFIFGGPGAPNPSLCLDLTASPSDGPSLSPASLHPDPNP